MAILDMGILGGFSGRVGTVVGYRRRGAWFVRAYRPHIKDRKSAAQLEQRSRFKAMIQFASPATPLLRIGLKQAADRQGITEGNAFLRMNHGWFGGGAGNSGRVDYAGLQFSCGTLSGVQGLRYAVSGGVARVKWSAAGGRMTDRIHIYIYSATQRTGLCLQGERAMRRLQALLPEGFADGEAHVWAFAADEDNRVSATAYALPEQAESEGSEAPTAAKSKDLDLSVRKKDVSLQSEAIGNEIYNALYDS